MIEGKEKRGACVRGPRPLPGDAENRSGFPVLLRDENRSVEQTLAPVEKRFGLDETKGIRRL